jgi:hypothetical protein
MDPILLTDGSGLSSRQVANLLSIKKHIVHLLSPPYTLSFTLLTRHVTKVHKVPKYGRDPFAWRTAVVSIISKENISTILCTQEQVAVLSAYPISGVNIAVPSFTSLMRVFDKISAYETLNKASLPQPETAIVSTSELEKCSFLLPAYVKLPVGTASSGVRPAQTPQDLPRIATSFSTQSQTVLIQRQIHGPLLMITSVFSHGKLLAYHCCLRMREGPNGGAVSKISYHHPQVKPHLEKLGRMLSWHGALSLDAILDSKRDIYYIDINPRIVEPVNAYHAGLDLPTLLLDVTFNHKVSPLPEGKEGIKTHQTGLGLVDSALKAGRAGVVREVWDLLMGRGCYEGSTEELTPTTGDLLSVVSLVGLIVLLLIVGQRGAGKLTSGTVSNYALGGEGWKMIVEWYQNQDG